MDTKLPEPTIATTQPSGDKTAPRQPNERDESPDSQASPPRADMKQAAEDVASGQVDTDLYSHPEHNPKNGAPSTASPKPAQVMPDGTRK